MNCIFDPIHEPALHTVKNDNISYTRSQADINCDGPSQTLCVPLRSKNLGMGGPEAPVPLDSCTTGSTFAQTYKSYLQYIQLILVSNSLLARYSYVKKISVSKWCSNALSSSPLRLFPPLLLLRQENSPMIRSLVSVSDITSFSTSWSSFEAADLVLRLYTMILTIKSLTCLKCELHRWSLFWAHQNSRC